jgi:uncharacterized protein YecE (DUF72 family)
MPEIRIGTSGWHYKHWRGNFYESTCPPREYLSVYLTRFDTVEINGSYYRLPTPETLRAWYENTPKDFLFTFKASRFLTHNKKLKDAQDPLNRVLRCAEILRDKLGPILFQLPPHWRINLERLKEFTALLPKVFEYAFEFREPSWFCEPVYDILKSRNLSFCVYSMKGEDSQRAFTGDTVYVRMHGAEGKYHGNYPMDVLRRWANDIRAWSKTRRVLVYFNNDPEGHAHRNAQELKDLLKLPTVAEPPMTATLGPMLRARSTATVVVGARGAHA